MEADLAPGQYRTSIWLFGVAGFMLIASEFNLVERILFKPGSQSEPFNYLIPILILAPIIAGLLLVRRMKNLETSGAMSSRAVSQIVTQLSSLLSITYCSFLILAISL
jgi:hypothetical protein